MNRDTLKFFSIIKACAVGYLTISAMELVSYMVFGVSVFGSFTDRKYAHFYKPKADELVEEGKHFANKSARQADVEPKSLQKNIQNKAEDVTNSDNVDEVKEKVKDKAKDVADSIKSDRDSEEDKHEMNPPNSDQERRANKI